jgi:hypothetical protein
VETVVAIGNKDRGKCRVNEAEAERGDAVDKFCSDEWVEVTYIDTNIARTQAYFCRTPMKVCGRRRNHERKTEITNVSWDGEDVHCS